MSVNLGESRSELLQWLNQTLDLNYTKVEQCGSGAAYCQIIDSIYGDVQMNRVNFNATFEYEFLNNYKVLQSAFVKHGITKVVLVEKLVKCKLQDNLEFLQWLKRFWTENKDESDYDPNSRRKPLSRGAAGSRSGSAMNNSRPGAAAPAATGRPLATRKAAPAAAAPRSTAGVTRPKPATHSSNDARQTASSRAFGNSASLGAARPRTMPSAQSAKLQKELEEAQTELSAINEELNEYKIAAEGLETERNFYFNKLRDIEILSQAVTDQLSEEAEKQHQQQLNGEISTDILRNNQSLIEFVEKIQDILYSTEEGFQVPDQAEEGEEVHEPIPEQLDDESF